MPIKIKHTHLFKLKPTTFFIFIMTLLLLTLTFISLLLFFSLSSASHHHHHKPPYLHPNGSSSPGSPSANDISRIVMQACHASQKPETCVKTIMQCPKLLENGNANGDSDVKKVLECALWVSNQNLKKAQEMSKSILEGANENKNKTSAAKNCLEVLGYAEHRLAMTEEALLHGTNAGVKDSRAWTSAAELYEYVCWSALKYVNDSSAVNETMVFMDGLIGLTSNALGMIVSYDLFGNETEKWKVPLTERSGFWEDGNRSVGGDGGGLSAYKGGFPVRLKEDVTVCKDGSCEYKTVQSAVDAVPVGGKRFVIKIKEGVYDEIVRVPLEKPNVVFLGDGRGKTVITGNLNVGMPGFTTYNTATVGVVGDGFMARDLTFENTAGPDTHQAVAFRSDSDLSILENCEFLGNQDTLYAHALRQFYKSCRIEGNVDFIFGNSASIFHDSQILIRPRQQNPEKGENNVVTAHGRTDPAQSTGFVFQNCVINGTEEYMELYYSKPLKHKNFLGRPWKAYSRTVFIHCKLEALVTKEGWLPWDKQFGLSTLYYGEFENSGLGSNATARVPWSSQIPEEHVYSYSVENFIQGNEWIPNSLTLGC